jgi:Mg2+-importing ATPase
LTTIEPNASPAGLTTSEAAERLIEFGENRLKEESRSSVLFLLFGQFKSPIILILIAAAIVSIFLRDHTDALLILSIVLVSGLLGFWQEYGAAHAVAKLSAMVETKVRVLRDSREVLVPLAQVVPGDVVLLSAGAMIPGDARLLEARELFVNEAVLTGETFPAEKTLLPNDRQPGSSNDRAELFMGTHVVSGSGMALIVSTGKATRFGQIAKSLRLRRPETEFERGVRRFGYLLAQVTLLLVLVIFAFNVFLHKPVLDSFLFALALAVGLTPQLLPAIITINLAHGARRMAEHKVIVKRLAAIENFGSMNVLCSDKTGTITEGTIEIVAAVDAAGEPSAAVSLCGYLNAVNETGFANPIDEALRARPTADCAGWNKLDELPYDFVRRRLSVLVKKGSRRLLVAKGALQEILQICTQVELSNGSRAAIDSWRDRIDQQWRTFSAKGSRVLGVASREYDGAAITRDSETEMTFLGFIALSDPPKPGIQSNLRELEALGIELKIITGDNALVAAHVAREVGLDADEVLTGAEILKMSDAALLRRASEVAVFAEIQPGQKEKLILALQKAGHVVGYIGDGINDASALHAADVSLSVDGAVDVAREAADLVLLEHDLGVLVEGVREGRRTFANTLKYVFIATSANFGNMFSMAGASLFLSFLPLLPKQILLMNLLTDFPEMTIAGDQVDAELTAHPRRWDIHFIRRFMLVFGLLSSVFDYLTFGALIWLRASVEEFRTGWFLESVISAALVVLVVRTRHAFFKSRPSKLLTLATIAVIALTMALPVMPFAPALGFSPVPIVFYLVIAAIVASYVSAAEFAKDCFTLWR